MLASESPICRHEDVVLSFAIIFLTKLSACPDLICSIPPDPGVESSEPMHHDTMIGAFHEMLVPYCFLIS